MHNHISYHTIRYLYIKVMKSKAIKLIHFNRAINLRIEPKAGEVSNRSG